MKKIISFPLVYIFYYIGDLISKTWKTKYNKKGRGYNIYNICMTLSSDIQEWSGMDKPWEKVEPEN